MKVSVVTISFNQARFVERAIKSVLNQSADEIEYIVVDPGSTDGSREIINRYKDRITQTILEKDDGPADGLNRGFARASGDIYCYLNADDEFCDDAFCTAEGYFSSHPDKDVVCGHAYLIDANGRPLRRIWSDPFNILSQAYGYSIQVQPSTFIRARSFKATQGFNPANQSNWDGELLIDLALSGAKIGIIDSFLSKYRVHNSSITGSGKIDELIRSYSRSRFERLMGRKWRGFDSIISKYWFIRRQLRNPEATLERLRYGPVYRSGSGL
jgi:glycosyltransferase involved in cell wall biosynthesis